MRRTLLSVALLATVAAGCGGGGTDLSADGLIAQIRKADLCGLPDLGTDSTDPPKSTLVPEKQGATDSTVSDADQVSLLCAGLTIKATDDGWEFTTAPNDSILFYGDLEEALALLGTKTGCWSDLEVQTIVSTRALDGRVESRNGRASWSYHPDNGLSILCFKKAPEN